MGVKVGETVRSEAGTGQPDHIRYNTVFWGFLDNTHTYVGSLWDESSPTSSRRT